MFSRFIKYLGAKGIILSVLFLMIVIFCMQNLGPISVRLLFWEIASISKLYIVLFPFLIGLLIGAVLTWSRLSSKADKDIVEDQNY